MDLLSMIHNNKLTLEDAEHLFDIEITKIHDGETQPDWRVTFELSNYEATAYLHEATLKDLVKLRYEGWPTTCCRCHLPLDYKQYGWWFVHGDDGIPRLRHITCPTIN